MEKKEYEYIVGGNEDLVQPLWKILRKFLRKLKMQQPLDPAIPLLGLYPKNPEILIQKNLCTPMFTAAQFTVAEC